MERASITRRNLLAASAALPAARVPNLTQTGILRSPDSVAAFIDKSAIALQRTGDRWTARHIAVTTANVDGGMEVRIEAAALSRVHLRWRLRIPERWRILNDHWERSYGDLEWRCIVPERILPWYFLAWDGSGAYGCGVKTGASAFAFWQVDPDGISLWLDLRNGGSPVALAGRSLSAATIVARDGEDGQSAFEFAHDFCKLMCGSPRLPSAPVYGGNNWYYAYGQNCSAEDILRDAELISELSPSGGNRPFMVIDDGWTPVATCGPWDHGNPRFPDMPALAAGIKNKGASPGIWFRPLCTTAKIPESAALRRREEGAVLDPSIPENLRKVREDVERFRSWGFELIKHDFTSFDITGRWGFAMNSELSAGGWRFSDKSRTTAEITLDLYRTISESAGSGLVIGCNTFGHLAAGIFELQRTGDDTSGRDFNRTRRMGVNTLAFRMPQHRAFFDLDADCAAITPEIPWELASAWLDLLARSGTSLFVSPDPKSVNAQTRDAMKRAFSEASRFQSPAIPLDWMDCTAPNRWSIESRESTFDWYGPDGASPFPS